MKTSLRARDGMPCPYQGSDDGPLEGPVDLSQLTDREKQVLLLLGGGPSNGELSRRLKISERTVKAHISRILIKTGQSSRLQAAMISALYHHQLCPSPSCRWSPAAGSPSHGVVSAA
ncbi:helix-turn-helix transcriptional regulator [Streptomyces decoyicus]|uniref:helix-turn-helix domain-containing protein n=1 Tax=Streptomyces decoyicus TaxID=249567 RepID=UPI002E18E1CE|nr:helix-turn-helix transcriptional regulator [Streptomyces decoyicus]